MLNIPESVKTLFKTDGTHKNFRAHFPNGEFPDITNENIVRESLTITESICSQDVFKFGLAEASVLEFETVGIGNMYGMTIQASIEIDLSSLTAAEIAEIEAGTWDGELVELSASDLGFAFFRIPLGVFRIEKCPRNHGAMTHRKVVAYSADQIAADPNGTIPGMPTELPIFPYYTADVAGVLAARNGEGLTRLSDLELTEDFYSTANLCDANGIRYTLRVHVIGAYDSLVKYEAVGNSVDFVRTGSYDANAYYALGVSVADKLTEAGLDLTYGPGQKKVYSSNLEALETVAAWLFYPVLCLRMLDGAEPLSDRFYVRLSPETLQGVPVFAFEGHSSDIAGRLFKLGGASLSGGYQSQPRIYCFIPRDAGSADVVLQNINDGTISHYNISLPYQDDPPVFERYSGTASGMTLRIQNSGALPTKHYTAVIASTSGNTTKAATAKMYSYANTVDYPKLVNGCYELKGQFAKTDRVGGLETVALSPTPYISMGPGDYDEVWWDEYDVAPIGSVVVTVNDQNKNNAQNTPTSINIGSGASIYDMSDNEAMELLEANTVSQIRALLRGEFKTNATHAGFTPIDLTVQGWPWLEAGDALRITAEDGTVVKTYALRVEMSGIQHLMASITAEGGEIVGEV